MPLDRPSPDSGAARDVGCHRVSHHVWPPQPDVPEVDAFEHPLDAPAQRTCWISGLRDDAIPIERELRDLQSSHPPRHAVEVDFDLDDHPRRLHAVRPAEVRLVTRGQVENDVSDGGSERLAEGRFFVRWLVGVEQRPCSGGARGAPNRGSACCRARGVRTAGMPDVSVEFTLATHELSTRGCPLAEQSGLVSVGAILGMRVGGPPSHPSQRFAAKSHRPSTRDSASLLLEIPLVFLVVVP